MKKNICALMLCMLLITSYARSIQSEKSPVTIRIRGKVEGYKKSKDNGYISFRKYDLTGRSKDTAIAIAASGEFFYNMQQPFTGNLGLLYQSRYLEFYGTDNEEVGIVINGNIWGSGGPQSKTIRFSGRSAAVSAAILEYREAVTKNTFKAVPDPGNKEQSDSAFAAVSRLRVEEELLFLEKFIDDNKLKLPEFYNWQKYQIIYEAAHFITFYCFAGKRNSSITYEQLASYLRFAPVENPSALHNSVYYEFVNSWGLDLQIITNLNPGYLPLVKEQGNNPVSVYLDKIDQFASGYAKQLMYLSLYNNRNRNCEVNYPRFEKTVTDPVLRAGLIGKRESGATGFQSFNLYEKLRLLPEGDQLVAKISGSSGKQNDQFLYLDFWGSWCGPCMSEMPFYPQLINALDTLPVRFVFLAVETPAEKISETRSKYRINGEFIALTGNETRMLNNALSFSSYPAHFLLDPKGNVVTDRMYGIASGSKLNPAVVKDLKEQIRD